VANTCYDKWQPTEPLTAALRDDIDGLAAHFHLAERNAPRRAGGTKKSIFFGGVDFLRITLIKNQIFKFRETAHYFSPVKK
jgi:hypothetical protein